MQSAHDDLSKPVSKRDRLRRAVDAVMDLLDPDIEPRSVSDAINLLGAVDLAIEFIRVRPEFSGLDSLEVEEVHSRALDQITWKS